MAALPADIRTAFNAAVARSGAVPRDLRWFDSVTSTMTVAEDAVHSGAAEPLIVVADEQTHGRGRRGRAWSSPPGAGLYLSFVFPSRPRSGGGSLLTLAAGVAVRSAIIRATGLSSQLKWPNDIMVGRRKLGGILAEGLGVGTAQATVVLGIGINILSAAHGEDVASRATSLQDELGRNVDRASVLEEVLVAVPDAYDGLGRGNTSDILRQWRDAAPSAHGASVEWRAQSGPQRGTTAGIDDTGALLVRTSTGVERIVGGEVLWV